MKTLAVILHYNSIQYTNTLYEILKPYEGEDYELVVIDNGSDPHKQSQYSTLILEKNVYFGGGLNAAMQYMLDEEKFDSLLFLNSDLIVHGPGFVKTLKKELSEFDVVSPCIIQPMAHQNHWRQMHCWHTKETRNVRWIDLQAPLFSKRFIQNLKDRSKDGNYIDPLLIYGWGLDILFGIICEDMKWKIGVCDHVPAVHLGSATIKDNLDKLDIFNYCTDAERLQWEFFQKESYMARYKDMRSWAENYKSIG